MQAGPTLGAPGDAEDGGGLEDGNRHSFRPIVRDHWRQFVSVDSHSKNMGIFLHGEHPRGSFHSWEAVKIFNDKVVKVSRRSWLSKLAVTVVNPDVFPVFIPTKIIKRNFLAFVSPSLLYFFLRSRHTIRHVRLSTADFRRSTPTSTTWAQSDSFQPPARPPPRPLPCPPSFLFSSGVASTLARPLPPQYQFNTPHTKKR